MNKFTNADKNGQTILLNQLEKIFDGYTVNVTQHYQDNATVDVDMYVTNNTTNNTYLYNIETKDREYTHTYFKEWLIEEHKVKELLAKNGKPIYANTFKDKWLIMWDLSKIDFSKVRSEYKWLPDTTVIKKGNKKKLVYYLPVDMAVYSSPFL